MTAKDINPFIRRAFILSKKPLNKRVINPDCRLFYVLNGNGRINIENQSFLFEKDFMCIFKSNTEYCWDFSKNNVVELAIINFDFTQEYRAATEYLDLIFPENGVAGTVFYCDDFSDIKLFNTPTCIRNAHLFKKNVLDIISAFEATTVLSRELAEANLKQLMIKVAQYLTSLSNNNSTLNELLEYINANFNKEISNSELGAISNYHPHHINLLMKRHTGTTLHAYITQQRMNEALKMLTYTNKSIEKISEEIGYKNPSHFYKIFKHTYDMSPSKYRKTITII